MYVLVYTSICVHAYIDIASDLSLSIYICIIIYGIRFDFREVRASSCKFVYIHLYICVHIYIYIYMKSDLIPGQQIRARS